MKCTPIPIVAGAAILFAGASALSIMASPNNKCDPQHSPPCIDIECDNSYGWDCFPPHFPLKAYYYQWVTQPGNRPPCKDQPGYNCDDNLNFYCAQINWYSDVISEECSAYGNLEICTKPQCRCAFEFLSQPRMASPLGEDCPEE